MKIFTYIKHDSSRIKRKNFINFKGQPLWTVLVEELNSLGKFFIDTDSHSVKEHCDKNYKDVFCYMRDQKFVDMENDPNNIASPALLMTRNFLDNYVEDDEEVIVLTHVTSPFLKKETILSASQLVKDDEFEFVHSVTAKKDFAWLENFENPINFNPEIVQRTQDLQEVVFSNGAFFIFKKKSFIKYNNRMGKKNFLYKINNIEGIEIDYQDDLVLANIVLKGLGEK